MKLRRIILGGLVTILFLLPLPYGAVDEWAIFAFEVAVAFLFLLYAFFEESSRRAENKGKNLVGRILFFLLIIFLAVLILQIIPLPSAVIQVLSPQKFKIHGKAMEILGDLRGEGQRPAWSYLSLAPALSRYEFLKYLAYFLFGYLLLKSVNSQRDIQVVVVCLVAAGLFQAIYGLAEYLSGTNRIFGYTNIWGRGSAFGTFINRDHYAGFLEMIFPLSLGYLLTKADFFALKRGVTFRQKIVWFSQEKLQRTLLLGALTALIGLGLLFSRSRSGVIIFVIIFFLMMLALSVGAREEREERTGIKEGGKPGGKQGKKAGGKLGGKQGRIEGIREFDGEVERRDESRAMSGVVSGFMNGTVSGVMTSVVSLVVSGVESGVKNGVKSGVENGVKAGEGREWEEVSPEFKERSRSLSLDLDSGEPGLAQSRIQSGKRSQGASNHFRGNPGTRRMLRLIRTVTLAVIFMAIFIGLRPIIERFTLESFWKEARPKFYELTMRMVVDYPILGTGAGTYIHAYTPYENQDFHGILHHAHNDYLETLAEMGLIGGGAIILAAGLAFGILFWRWRQLPQRDYFRRGIGLGLIAGIAAILIHSLSDFNLRVPANAIYFISFYIIAWRLHHES